MLRLEYRDVRYAPMRASGTTDIASTLLQLFPAFYATFLQTLNAVNYQLVGGFCDAAPKGLRNIEAVFNWVDVLHFDFQFVGARTWFRQIRCTLGVRACAVPDNRIDVRGPGT